jgi:coenzyme F420 hydrogenase subunit beta
MVETTVKEIGCSHLCNGCGTCAGICPSNAIRMDRSSEGIYLPTIEYAKCNNCGLCLNVCPGHSIDFEKLNMFVFGKVPKDVYLANYINCYIGHSTNKGIRWSASSGGIVTSLLIFGLEERIIDGALVTRMRKDAPLEPEVIIARTKEEVVTALGSKYCPVPVNGAITEILKEKGKFAVVGLPCHIHGIRKAEMLNKRLREKIVLHIGLFCSHSVSFLGTEVLLEKIGVRKEDITKLSYRGKGWPGGMSIVLKNGHERFIEYTDYWDCLFGLSFFTPIRCTFCADVTNELSDISAGDAWLPELKGERTGMSMIVTRTKIGEEFLHHAESKEKVKIVNVDSSKVKQAQAGSLNFKKKTLAARISLAKHFGQKLPDVNPKPSASKVIRYLYVALPYLNIYVFSKRGFRYLLKYVPFRILRMYFRFLCALFLFV